MKVKRQPLSDETKRKISLACKGRTAWNKGTKGKVKANRTSFKKGDQGRLGCNHSEETKRRISETKQGQAIGIRNPHWNPNRHSTEQIECGCGCGTLIPKWDRKGRPGRYVVGHQLRGKARPDVSAQLRQMWVDGKITPVRGERHGMWKGGITPLMHLLRSTPEYKAWRLAVYKRDHWTCQDCGKHCDEKQIVAHHLKSFKDYPELRYEISNGITFCRKCHLNVERH